MEMEQETVYGTEDDSHVVMSDKVQSLAGRIYQELEKMITKYDDDVVKDLMPLVVNVLESLDLSYTENQEHQVELELLREDNEQLVTQYEREKQLRKASEQKLLELEDLIEDERKEKGSKIESLESIVRMLELKAKNSSDHVYRLEEKEQEMKKEFAKLHERYTELLKTHMDTIERTKILMGTNDRLENARPRLAPLSLAHMSRSCGPMSLGFQSLETQPSGMGPGSGSPLGGDYSPARQPVSSSPDSRHARSLLNELERRKSEERREDEEGERREEDGMRDTGEAGRGNWSLAETLSGCSTPGASASGKEASPTSDISAEEGLPSPLPTPGRSTTKKEERSGNTLYQELSFQDAEALGEMDEGADITGGWVHPGEYASSVNDNFFGMGKEVENLIMENNELLATKNALNIVKDDLIIKVDELTSEQEIMREELRALQAVNSRLKQKISELEEDLKKAKEEMEKYSKSNRSDDEEDVPMAQRKRFTRVEMARVLMERNQYKERFMELQEAVRFTEMVRASKTDSDLEKKDKNSVWKIFSRFFITERGLPSKGYGGPGGGGGGYYSGGGGGRSGERHISPALDTMRKRSMHERRRGLDLDPSDLGNEKAAARRASERREQLRAVQAHVRKDDGRLHAYGWSLPAKGGPPPQVKSTSSQVPVPVPVYCRPLMEKEDGMKIWCAAGVNLAGGKTKDGGDIVGASIFYDKEPSSQDSARASSGDGQTKEEKERAELSSVVWICTSTRSISYVTVIDANNPADILEAFPVCQSHLLCIASVPGASESDYPGSDSEDQLNSHISLGSESNDNDTLANNNQNQQESENQQKDNNDNQGGTIGRVVFVSCATGSDDLSNLTPQHHQRPPPSDPHLTSNPHCKVEGVENGEDKAGEEIGEKERLADGGVRRLVKELSDGYLKDGVVTNTENEIASEELGKMSSVLPTMWLGAQNGCVFVHSAITQWKRCLHSVKLKDSVLSIVETKGRVLCAVADCSVAIFRRDDSGQWDLSRYHVVDLGPPLHSVRCLLPVYGDVWCGYKNKIHVLDPISITLKKSLDVHPRKESHVRQMAWIGDGVWVSIRLDSTLRLYHARTYQHLQDVDIEPYVSKMLGTGKLGFSFVRITALLISSSRLWIGTGNGVIISVPFSDSSGISRGGKLSLSPGKTKIVEETTVTEGEEETVTPPAGFIPYCSMQHAQLSFHGHKDTVKFFVAVPGSGGMGGGKERRRVERKRETDEETGQGDLTTPPQSMLVLSGGEGYIDFRVGDDDDEGGGGGGEGRSGEPDSIEGKGGGITKVDPSYLIVWQVCSPNA